MKSFTYMARDAGGARRDGILAANSRNEALEILHHRRLTPIGIQETVVQGTAGPTSWCRRVKSADLGAMCWQLSTMLEGGMSLTAALDVMASDTENLQLCQLLQQARARVSEGRLLSESFGGSPRIFSRLAVAIIIAGETSGDLGQALSTLAEHFDSRDRLAKKVHGGVPVLDALEILRGMTTNDVIIAAIARARQHVMGGSNIALGLAAAGFFPAMMVKMTQVGEESGNLPAILRKTSAYYERRIVSTIDTVTDLLEPLMIVVIGAVVLVVVIALYLPIFAMSDVVP